MRARRRKGRAGETPTRPPPAAKALAPPSRGGRQEGSSREKIPEGEPP